MTCYDALNVTGLGEYFGGRVGAACGRHRFLYQRTATAGSNPLLRTGWMASIVNRGTTFLASLHTLCSSAFCCSFMPPDTTKPPALSLLDPQPSRIDSHFDSPTGH